MASTMVVRSPWRLPCQTERERPHAIAAFAATASNPLTASAGVALLAGIVSIFGARQSTDSHHHDQSAFERHSEEIIAMARIAAGGLSVPRDIESLEYRTPREMRGTARDSSIRAPAILGFG